MPSLRPSPGSAWEVDSSGSARHREEKRMSSSHQFPGSTEEAKPPGYDPDDDWPKPSGFDQDGDGTPEVEDDPQASEAGDGDS